MKKFPLETNEVPPIAVYCLRIHPDLKKALVAAARDHHLATNEFVAGILADFLEKPELAQIPRKPFGRHPKAEATNGHKKNGKKSA